MSIIGPRVGGEPLKLGPTQFNISVRDLEVLLDAYAYLLSTDVRTSNVNWILGEVGMGAPSQTPFGYISVMTESPTWYTANGGTGGLGAAGTYGLDDWLAPILLTVCIAPHDYAPPQAAAPPPSSPFSQQSLGSAPPYYEQPGWRTALAITQNIKKVMRTNSTIGGAATDTRIVESRYGLVMVQNTMYRAQRMQILTQQRRIRGN